MLILGRPSVTIGRLCDLKVGSMPFRLVKLMIGLRGLAPIACLIGAFSAVLLVDLSLVLSAMAQPALVVRQGKCRAWLLLLSV